MERNIGTDQDTRLSYPQDRTRVVLQVTVSLIMAGSAIANCVGFGGVLGAKRMYGRWHEDYIRNLDITEEHIGAYDCSMEVGFRTLQWVFGVNALSFLLATGLLVSCWLSMERIRLTLRQLKRSPAEH